MLSERERECKFAEHFTIHQHNLQNRGLYWTLLNLSGFFLSVCLYVCRMWDRLFSEALTPSSNLKPDLFSFFLFSTSMTQQELDGWRNVNGMNVCSSYISVCLCVSICEMSSLSWEFAFIAIGCWISGEKNILLDPVNKLNAILLQSTSCTKIIRIFSSNQLNIYIKLMQTKNHVLT